MPTTQNSVPSSSPWQRANRALSGPVSQRPSLADPGVSRYHCWILFRDGAPSVEDLASANGTFVNGERIRVRMALKPGDVIRVGSTEIQVSEEA